MTSLDSKLSQGQDLVDAMTDAELNEHIDYIRTVLSTRRRIRNAKAVNSVKVGDRVRLTGRYKPQYLTGLTGEITDRKNTRVVVTLDCGPVGKFRSGTVTTSPSGLTVI